MASINTQSNTVLQNAQQNPLTAPFSPFFKPPAATPAQTALNGASGGMSYNTPPTPTQNSTIIPAKTGNPTNYGSTNPLLPTTPYPGAAPGSFQNNLNAVSNAQTFGQGQENAINSQLQQAGLLYGNRGSAPLGGFNIGGAAQNFQAGQAGLLNSLVASATPQLQDIQAQRNAALTGSEATAGLTQPQAYGITSTPYQPGTNTFGTLPGGETGATGAGIVQGQIGAGQQYAANQAILGKVQAQLPALQDAITTDNFDPNGVTGLNQIYQWAQGGLSNATIPEVQGSLNDIVGGLSQVLGVPSSAGSDLRLQFAGAIVNSLQSGQSIQQAIQFAVSQATQGNQGYLQGAEGATTTGGTQPIPQQYAGVQGLGNW